MTSEQIEQSVYRELTCFDWASGKSISCAAVHAQYLFEAYFCYFYVPATGTFFCVERDGNYYHGYENIVNKCSREDVLQAAERQLACASRLCAGDAVAAFWEDMCSKLHKLPYFL